MSFVKILVPALLLITLMTTTSEAMWPVFHEPLFSGKVVDIKTKQPIKDAVIVAMYYKRSMGAGAGQYSTLINFRETLTDKDGNYRFPSYTTMLLPLTWQKETVFIIYKRGYASLQLYSGFIVGDGWKEKEGSWPDNELSVFKYRLRENGTIEIPKLETKEQRRRTLYIADIAGAEVSAKKLPILYKAIDAEKKELDGS